MTTKHETCAVNVLAENYNWHHVTTTVTGAPFQTFIEFITEIVASTNQKPFNHHFYCFE